MIASKTETAITCDKCGRTIEVGERWYQATQTAACATFDGTASGLTGVYELAMQLCEPDYLASVETLQNVSPSAVPIEAPLRAETGVVARAG